MKQETTKSIKKVKQHHQHFHTGGGARRLNGMIICYKEETLLFSSNFPGRWGGSRRRRKGEGEGKYLALTVVIKGRSCGVMTK